MIEIRMLGRGLLQGPCGTSHPEAVAVAGTFGSWAKGKPIARGKGVHHNSLLPVSDDRIDVLSGAIDDCVEVKVYKAEE